MDIQSYFNKINSESQKIFNISTQQKESLGTLHHYSSCLFEFSEYLVDPQEKLIFNKVCLQLESATFNLLLGLYRQAFSSLRLAFELGLAVIHFSAHKLELNEWIDGRLDINWSTLMDEQNGVLSKRFTNAFFYECSEHVYEYHTTAKTTYRALSEYVHGNNETWDENGLKLRHDENLFQFYVNHYKNVFEVIMFSATCRYAKSLGELKLESLQFIPEEFNNILAIRKLFGRS